MTEWNASGYQSVSHLQEAIATEQLSRVTLGERDCVLDIGCGNGKITAAIASRIPQGSVLGVDASQNMITFARKHYGSPNYPNLHFEVADARDLPFQHEFDQIVSFNAIHWVPEQHAVLHSIYTALKPDGQALLRFVPEGSRKCLEDVIENTCRSSRWSAYFQDHHKPYSHPTPEAYRILAEHSGFTVVRLHVEDKSWNFGSRQGFFDYCSITFAEWLKFLPESEWAAFINDVLDHYQAIVASHPSENHTFKFYQMEVVLIPRLSNS